MTMSIDEYMQLLQDRQQAFMQQARTRVSPDARLDPLPPLLTWFIQDGDEDLVELPKPTVKPKPKPRYYRPASYWRARVQQIESTMAAVARKADVGDPAAARGAALGPRRTARHQRRADSALQRYVALEKQKSHAQSMLRSAERRELAPPMPTNSSAEASAPQASESTTC